jgi:hypothetical protein
MMRVFLTVVGLSLLLAMSAGCSREQWHAMDPNGAFSEWYEPDLPTVALNCAPKAPASQPVIRSRRPVLLYRPTPIRQAPAASQHPWAAPNKRPWRHIVIHHSASVGGNAQQFDGAHRDRGWDELGYHFVINNGQGGPDGRIEVGSRWPKQKQGAHCGGTPGNEFNELGIGICLVGEFSTDMPTQAQLESLERLTGYLMKTYRIAPEHVITHRDAPNAHTECPGGRFHTYVHGPFKRSMMPYYADARPRR